MTPLAILHADIEMRVQSILANRADWQCKMGCDSCCRSLAELPRLTLAEWEQLRTALAELPPERLGAIRDGVLQLKPSRPVTCPLLDLASGTCPVYAQRPVACRTYGFYAQRGLGLYCGDIEAKVADGELIDVVWGNHDAIDRRLAEFGEVRTLAEWFERWTE